MTYITIHMALIGSFEFEKTKLNQIWILSEIRPHHQGWHCSTEKIDILIFKENSYLEMISIEAGLIRDVKYELKEDREVILESGMSFGKIVSLDDNQLIIQNGESSSRNENVYTLLPVTEMEITESELIEQIK